MRTPLRAVSVAAATVAVFIAVCFTTRSNYERLVASTAELPARPIAGRLQGFPYLPPAPIRRGTTKPPSPRLLVTRAQATEIVISVATSAAQHHDRGVAKLLTSDFVGSIDDLTIAAAAQPSNAGYWSDLAAARLEQGSREDDGMILASALADVDRAISLDRNLPEAAFNRAVALQLLGVRTAATREYGRYLLLDAQSEWSAEIIASRLTAPIITMADEWNRVRPIFEVSCAHADTPTAADIIERFPEDARRWAEGEYLARWAVARLAGDSYGAEQSLLIARVTGELLEHRSGEKLLRDAVGTIDHAIAVRDSETIKTLAEAHRDYRTARIAYARRRIDDAAPIFESLERRFRSANSPMADVVAYYTANVAHDRNDADQCLRLVDAIARRIPPSYAALHAQILWMKSIALVRIGRVYESHSAASAAVKAFQRLGEEDNAAAVRASIADLLMYLGQPQQSWRIRRSVLLDASRLGDARLVEGALHGGARMAARVEDWNIARAIYAVQLSMPGVLPRVRAAAQSGYALAVSRAERRVLSATERQHLIVAANAISDRVMRDDALDEARVVDAMSRLNDDPNGALLLLNETIAYRSQRHRFFETKHLLVNRARAHHRLGDDTAAVADLKTATSIVDEEHRTIKDDDLRETFLGSFENPFIDLADLLLSTGHANEAWSVVERSRTAAVSRQSDFFSRAMPVSPADIANLLPANVAIVMPIAFPDRTAVLTVGQKRFFCDEFPEDQASVRNAVLSFAQSIAQGSPVPPQAETQLYKATIGLAFNRIPGVTTIVVVPDDVFAGVPYAALRNPMTHRYTVEDVAVATAPSASEYLRRTDRKLPAPSERRALLFGNPAIDRSEFPGLPPLPEAENEVRSVARLYRHATTYVGEDATLSSFAREAPGADVIDLAAHAIVNSEDPGLSAVPLAQGPEGFGLLSVDAIRRLRLRATPVVVLVGCGTAATSSKMTSIRSLSLAFVTAGARSVIGSLWDVDDTAGRQIAINLHQELANAIAPSTALRNAQLMMLHGTNTRWRSPRFWSGFQVYGSN
jgi:CHAT domain-containing protein/tetratricopeptide (TPR) repeat protein